MSNVEAVLLYFVFGWVVAEIFGRIYDIIRDR